jgi:undecaprenyl-diphosphatase
MNQFDLSINSFFNQFAQQFPLLDQFLVLISVNNLIKGGILLGLFWYLIIEGNRKGEKWGDYLFAGIVGAIVSVLLARLLAHLLPYRTRPLLTPDINYQIPTGMDKDFLIGWSSFPSDHAALFFALATTIFLVSRRMGILMFIYVLVFICIPRIYLGYHWATDIIAGALIGIGIALLFNHSLLRKVTNLPAHWIFTRSPSLFYSLFFILTFQVITLFEDLRKAGEYVLHTIKTIT